MSTNHYDIIIGTAIGGGILAQSLAVTGKKILIIKKGGSSKKNKFF